MKKVLFTSTVAVSAIFNEPFMQWFKEQGWEVHYACRDDLRETHANKHFCISFNRSPQSVDNFRAYGQLKNIIAAEKYDIIHCHTPMAGVITRLAARNARQLGTKVLYTAHGFHFYKGAPLQNWLLYYPVEKFLSKYTDCLVVMNEEDYVVAKSFKAGKVEKIDGVGVSLTKFAPVSLEEKSKLRNIHGYSDNDLILLYTAEFIPRKNHRFMLETFKELTSKIPSIKLLLAGKGSILEDMKHLSKHLGIENSVVFLGFCKNIPDMCRIADIQVSSSFQEGLPINILEGMATGLPVVCSKIRGHVDLLSNGAGILFDIRDKTAFISAIEQLHQNPIKRKELSSIGMQDTKKFSLENALKRMAGIYTCYMQ